MAGRRTRSQSPVPADNLYEDVETEPFDYAGRELDTLNVAHLGRILRSNIRCNFDKGTPDSVIELSTKLPAETRHNKKGYVAYVRREIERIRAIPDISTRMRLRKCEEDWRLAFGTSRSLDHLLPRMLPVLLPIFATVRRQRCIGSYHVAASLLEKRPPFFCVENRHERPQSTDESRRMRYSVRHM